MTGDISLARMAGPRTLALTLALPLALLAAGCGNRGEKAAGEAPATPQAVVEAAADPCGAQTGSYLEALCGDPDLAPLVGQIKTNLVEAASAVSMEGAEQLASGQKEWIEKTRLECGIADTKVPLTAQQEQCVKDALTGRTRAAGQAVQREGGFVFQTVEINRAVALPADVAADFGPDSGFHAVTKEIRYPRIEGETPQIKRFNQLMQQRPAYGAQDQISEWLDYKIAFAGPELVSVRFTGLEMSVGAAHPNDSERVVTVVMATGEPLKETDVFSAPPERWRADLLRRVRRDLVKQIRERGGPPELSETDLADTALKVKNWVVTEEALVVVIPSETIGPRVLGGFEVKIPWAQLAPLLNPNAPAPIKRA
jgi:hypothetical protein